MVVAARDVAPEVREPAERKAEIVGMKEERLGTGSGIQDPRDVQTPEDNRQKRRGGEAQRRLPSARNQHRAGEADDEHRAGLADDERQREQEPGPSEPL